MNAASKVEFLAHHRSLHVRSSRVTDPLFGRGDFFDPRDLLLVKYEMLRRVRVDHWPVARAARGVALSRTAWYDAMHRWEQRGLTGLIPDAPGPHADRVRPSASFFPDRVGGLQKGGSLPIARRRLAGGISGTRCYATIGWLTESPAKLGSSSGRGCWRGCGPARGTDRFQPPTSPPWVVNHVR